MTSERVLCPLFAGQNHFWGIFRSFLILFHQREDKRGKRVEINVLKGGSTSVCELLLKAGKHPNAGRLLGKTWKNYAFCRSQLAFGCPPAFKSNTYTLVIPLFSIFLLALFYRFFLSFNKEVRNCQKKLYWSQTECKAYVFIFFVYCNNVCYPVIYSFILLLPAVKMQTYSVIFDGLL